MRFWGTTLPEGPAVRATALVTHLHWDHVQGLPFLEALGHPDARLDVYGPPSEGGRFGAAMAAFMRPPYFPVSPDELGGEVRFHDLADEQFAVGPATVTARPVPHRGATNGYRVDWDGVSVAYVSDHQAPPGLDTVAEPVLELAAGVDLLIHDAQYTNAQWERKSDWGHCTVDYAVLVAREAGARCLALFHHDPDNGDDEVDRLLEGARRQAARLGVDEVVAAAEGLTLSFQRP